MKSTPKRLRAAFPLKVSLPQNEPRQLAVWEEKKLYLRIQYSRTGAHVDVYLSDAEMNRASRVEWPVTAASRSDISLLPRGTM